MAGVNMSLLINIEFGGGSCRRFHSQLVETGTVAEWLTRSAPWKAGIHGFDRIPVLQLLSAYNRPKIFCLPPGPGFRHGIRVRTEYPIRKEPSNICACYSYEFLGKAGLLKWIGFFACGMRD